MATNGAPQEGDQIETLEEAIDFLLKIMAASISYLSRKAPHIQTNPDVPLSVLPQAAKDALVDEETMVESAEELVQDLMIKAKQVEKLIKDLPEWSAANGEQLAQNGELQAVQTEMLVANKEYREAVEEARELQKQVSDLLRLMCEEQQKTQVAYARANGVLPAS